MKKQSRNELWSFIATFLAKILYDLFLVSLENKILGFHIQIPINKYVHTLSKEFDL